MKLLTYNFLTSKCMKGVKVGYPLKLTISQKTEVATDFNREFLIRLLPRLEWSAVYAAAEYVDLTEDIPKEPGENLANNSELLQKLHHLLLEIDIVEGELECPETGRKFPISDGIPNMLLNENEV